MKQVFFMVYGLWFGVMIALYIAGLAVGWVKRGFKK
jgi:hypothetical protein